MSDAEKFARMIHKTVLSADAATSVREILDSAIDEAIAETAKEGDMSKAKQYRKKPVVIEAIEYTENNAAEVLQFMSDGNMYPYPGENGVIIINTLEGQMTAKPGCFVIRGVQGEYYPCDGDIFRQTYEAVE